MKNYINRYFYRSSIAHPYSRPHLGVLAVCRDQLGREHDSESSVNMAFQLRKMYRY